MALTYFSVGVQFDLDAKEAEKFRTPPDAARFA